MLFITELQNLAKICLLGNKKKVFNSIIASIHVIYSILAEIGTPN